MLLNITIKADLSPDGCKQESLLMIERWQLIHDQSGVDHNLIKLGKQSLYVVDKLYGKVVNLRSSFKQTEGFTVPACHCSHTTFLTPNSNESNSN